MISMGLIVYYAICSVLAFYIPGYLVLRNVNLSRPLRHIWSPILGMAMWGIQAWMFGWLSMRFLSYIYILCTLSYWLYCIFRKIIIFRSIILSKKVGISIGIICLGMVIQLSTTIFWYEYLKRYKPSFCYAT